MYHYFKYHMIVLTVSESDQELPDLVADAEMANQNGSGKTIYYSNYLAMMYTSFLIFSV